MTSAAITILTASAVSTPQSVAQSKGSSADQLSFSATLQKAGKAQSSESSVTSGAELSNEKTESQRPAPPSTSADSEQKVDPAEVVEEAIPAAGANPPKGKPDLSDSAPKNPAATGMDGSALHLTKEDSVDSAAAVEDQFSTTPPVADYMPVVVAQPQPQVEQVADHQAQNPESKLGSSILASINMGKSLERPSAAKDLPVVTGSGKGEASDATLSATPLAAANAVVTEKANLANTGAATNASDSSPEIALPAVNRGTQSEVSKLASDGAADGKSTEFQARLDSVGSNQAAVATQGASTQSSSAATPSATLQTPVSSPDWAKNLGQQLVNFHLKGDQNVQLHLNPSNLGPMSITLNVNEHLQATAHFASHSVQVRSALEQGITQLRDAMAQQGISLGDTSVGEQRQQGFSQSAQGNSSRVNIQQLAGINLIEDETVQVAAQPASVAGEISTYA